MYSVCDVYVPYMYVCSVLFPCSVPLAGYNNGAGKCGGMKREKGRGEGDGRCEGIEGEGCVERERERGADREG